MKPTFRRLLAFTGVLLLTAVIAGCASTGPIAREQADLPSAKVDARAVFQENCSRCHGVDGRAHNFHGMMLDAQNLTSNTWQLDTTDDDIIEAMHKGPGAMPSFDHKLSDSEIKALCLYVRTLKIGE